MQHLYYTPSTEGRREEFCIYNESLTRRNYRCNHLDDPDLLRPAYYVIAPSVQDNAYCILSAPFITKELLHQELPEFFI